MIDIHRKPEIIPKYHIDHHGGGLGIGLEFVHILKNRYDNKCWNHCLEWCSGPGFIGFDILSQGLCKKLTLHDKHRPLQKNIDRTIEINRLADRVDYYFGETLDCIPERKFDLIVANPPHFLDHQGDENYQRLAVDQNWTAHKNFFSKVKNYLDDDGIILLQEDQRGSKFGPMEFSSMIEENHLYISSFWSSHIFWGPEPPEAEDCAGRPVLDSRVYYIEIKHYETAKRDFSKKHKGDK